jgi:diguanylate cyclase (GGDEF)-like protein
MSSNNDKKSILSYAELLDSLKATFFLTGVSIALFVWIIDPFIDAVFLYEGTISQYLFNPNIYEVYIRSVISSIIIIFSFIGSVLLIRYKRANEALKENEKRFRYIAQHDPLTGLPNRMLFSDRLQQEAAIAKRDKKYFAVLFLDLDEFKPINDMFGHDVGDLLLKKVAKRIQDCVRESDTVARFSGDEFLVLFRAIENKQDAMVVAEKIRHALNQPFELVGQNLQISSSIGVAIYPDQGVDNAQLLKNADIAMYCAKGNGRNMVQLFQPGMLAGIYL